MCIFRLAYPLCGFISLQRLDEPNVNDIPEQEDLHQGLYPET